MIVPCVADLVKVDKAITDGKRGADYMQKFPKGINLKEATVLIMCDSGHANGKPERDELAKLWKAAWHGLSCAQTRVLS